MKNRTLLYLTLLNFAYLKAFSQKATIFITDKVNEKYAYVDVTNTYERVAAKGYKSVDLFKKLGDSYYFNSNFEKAAKWYGELFAMRTQLEPEYYYQYADCLHCIGNTKLANEVLLRLNQKSEIVPIKKSKKRN
jgi:tetratricopeptide (TPR) repeat protein